MKLEVEVGRSKKQRKEEEGKKTREKQRRAFEVEEMKKIF